MNDSRISISIDVSQSTSPVRVMCKQGDTGRVMHISLTDGGYPYIISPDCNAIFTALKPDRNVIREPCTIENGIVVYEFTAQTCSVPGKMMAEIRICGEGDKYLTSASFQLIVEKTIYSKEETGGTESEITYLDQLISDAKRIIESCKEAVRVAKEATNAANKAASDANAAVETVTIDIDKIKTDISYLERQINQYHNNGGSSAPVVLTLDTSILDYAVLS